MLATLKNTYNLIFSGAYMKSLSDVYDFKISYFSMNSIITTRIKSSFIDTGILFLFYKIIIQL